MESHQRIADRRTYVHNQCQEVLSRVHSLHRLKQQRTHHAGQQDALRGGEVASADADKKATEHQYSFSSRVTSPGDRPCASARRRDLKPEAQRR
jgi:hypothetical protein